jgi:hypothetical protein
MLKYNDKVRVKSGFYEGMIGIVYDTTEDYRAGADVSFINYTVRFYFGDRSYREVMFSEDFLEKIKQEEEEIIERGLL